MLDFLTMILARPNRKPIKALNIIGVLSTFALIGCASQPINRDLSVPLNSVERVDIERYLGRWYEIARLPNSFEKNCEGVTADYTQKDDGTISVINSCNRVTIDGVITGKARIAKGRARIVDTHSQSKLEVSFFGPFWGDYWILDLDETYTLSLVGEPSGKYLWILSRTPTLPKDVLNEALMRLKAMGYYTDNLYFTIQPPVEN